MPSVKLDRQKDQERTSVPIASRGQMKIFIAGAGGAIGQPLVAGLIRQGHSVTGMTHSDAGAQKMEKAGAAVARVSAVDQAALAGMAESLSSERLPWPNDACLARSAQAIL
jgi:nucleoside-diphosphate-sugar epimerase